MTAAPSTYRWRKIRVLTVILLCALSIITGFIKSGRRVHEALDELKVAKRDAGDSFMVLKEELMKRHDTETLNKLKIAYFWDRNMPEEQNQAGETYYALQYAFIPLLIYFEEEDAQFFILNYPDDETRLKYQKDKKLSVMMRQGALVLTEKISQT